MFLFLRHCALDILVNWKSITCGGGYGLAISAIFYGPECSTVNEAI